MNIIVTGCRYQVNLRLAKLNKIENVARDFSLRITDHETMRIIEEGIEMPLISFHSY